MNFALNYIKYMNNMKCLNRIAFCTWRDACAANIPAEQCGLCYRGKPSSPQAIGLLIVSPVRANQSSMVWLSKAELKSLMNL